MAKQKEMDIERSQNPKTHSADEETATNEDYLVKCIGGFGTWQAKVCILTSLSRLLPMWNMLAVVFLTYDTEFLCNSFSGPTPVNVTPSTCCDDCTEYAFIEGVFVDSFVSEFELICNDAWMANFTQTVLMLGVMFGAPLFGWISDRYGRRTALLTSGFFDVVLMVAASFSPSYWMYNALRFLVGVASGGVLVVSVVVVLEAVGPQYREIAGGCMTIPDGLSEASLVAFAYFSPTWRVYLLGLSAACSLVMVFMLMVPETPRWLVASGRLDDARILMAEAAKINKLNPSTVTENINALTMSVSLTDKETTKTYCDLFKTKKLLVRTLATTFVWTVCGMCYFGINQYVTFLGSNVYVSVMILGLIQILSICSKFEDTEITCEDREFQSSLVKQTRFTRGELLIDDFTIALDFFNVPACFIAMWINKTFRRKCSTIGILSTIGLIMILLTFTPKDHWTAVFLGVAGLSSCSVSFNVIYIYTSELFPTPLRNMGYGLGTAGAKIGAMVAPFVSHKPPFGCLR